MTTPEHTLQGLNQNDRPPTRSVELFAKDFTQGQEGIVVPVVYGMARRSGIHVTPIFGFRSEPIVTEMSK